MRSILIKLTAGGALLMSLFFVQSCAKETPDGPFSETTDFRNNSLIRVFIATVNASNNFIYVDGKPINGAALASGGMFPASGIYASSITPGLKAFLVSATSGAQVPLSFAENMQVNKNYTIFMYDTINSPKQKTVETKFVIPTDTTTRIRFANFIYNPTIVPAIDVFSYNRNANIFTNVAVTDVTDFIAYPSRLGTDTLYIRETGSSTNIIKLPIGGLQEKRFYTIVYRGSHRGTRIATLYTER